MASGQSRDEGDHLAHHHRQHHHNQYQYPCQFQNHLNTKQAHYQKQDESQDQKTFSITDGISVIIITITITIIIIIIVIITMGTAPGTVTPPATTPLATSRPLSFSWSWTCCCCCWRWWWWLWWSSGRSHYLQKQVLCTWAKHVVQRHVITSTTTTTTDFPPLYCRILLSYRNVHVGQSSPRASCWFCNAIFARFVPACKNLWRVYLLCLRYFLLCFVFCVCPSPPAVRAQWLQARTQKLQRTLCQWAIDASPRLLWRSLCAKEGLTVCWFFAHLQQTGMPTTMMTMMMMMVMMMMMMMVMVMVMVMMMMVMIMQWETAAAAAAAAAAEAVAMAKLLMLDFLSRARVSFFFLSRCDPQCMNGIPL